jgi:hypothetical protein
MIDFMTNVVITFVMFGWAVLTLTTIFLSLEPRCRLPDKYLVFDLITVKMLCLFNLSLFVVTLGLFMESAEGCLQ